MAFWGGRGPGQGGFGGPRYSKQEPFVLFPDTDLPDVTQVLQKKINDEELLLIKQSLEWLKKSEYYHLEQIDKDNSFEQYLLRSMFPTELMTTRGSNVRKLSRGKVVWDRKKEESYWDRIEKIEQDREKKQPNADEDKEDDGDDEEDDANDEDPDMNDYIYDMKVDDDEDAYNDEDEGFDEPEL